jgi:hypothetical protein
MARRDFTIRAGNSGTTENPAGIVIVLKADGVAENLTGSVIVFRAVNVGTEVLRKDSTDGITVNATAGKITVPITVAESRALPPASLYEIEQRLDGGQRTRLSGRLIVIRGVNDD